MRVGREQLQLVSGSRHGHVHQHAASQEQAAACASVASMADARQPSCRVCSSGSITPLARAASSSWAYYHAATKVQERPARRWAVEHRAMDGRRCWRPPYPGIPGAVAAAVAWRHPVNCYAAAAHTRRGPSHPGANLPHAAPTPQRRNLPACYRCSITQPATVQAELAVIAQRLPPLAAVQRGRPAVLRRCAAPHTANSTAAHRPQYRCHTACIMRPPLAWSPRSPGCLSCWRSGVAAVQSQHSDVALSQKYLCSN